MNTSEARQKLKSLGWRTYNRYGLWVVYDRNGYNGMYTDRELIKLALVLKDSHWKAPSTDKCLTGPGGVECTCCTKAPKTEMKEWDRRAQRRKNKRIDLDLDFH